MKRESSKRFRKTGENTQIARFRQGHTADPPCKPGSNDKHSIEQPPTHQKILVFGSRTIFYHPIWQGKTEHFCWSSLKFILL
jgi:hypothetical protein